LALARDTLGDARRPGLAVLPYCPFVRSWLARHPDLVALVPPDRRAAFGPA
jgi:predicted GNAT family acetyltransferase